MSMTEDDLIALVSIDRTTLTMWVESGWVRPEGARYTEADLARAQLVADLVGPMGVNPEGVDIILDLLDQVHGLRAAMRVLGEAVEAQPEDLTYRVRAAVRRRRGSVRDL